MGHFSAGGFVGFSGEGGVAEGGGLLGGHREVKLHKPIIIEEFRETLQLRVDTVVEFDFLVDCIQNF